MNTISIFQVDKYRGPGIIPSIGRNFYVEISAKF